MTAVDELRPQQLAVASRSVDANDCRDLLLMLGLMPPPAPVDVVQPEQPGPPDVGVCGLCDRRMVPAKHVTPPEGWTRRQRDGLCQVCYQRCRRSGKPRSAPRRRGAHHEGLQQQAARLRAQHLEWKAVADQLGCSVRTAQRAHKLGAS